MKKGITMSVVLVAIVIMMLIISAATVVGTNAVSTANFEEFKSIISRVSDDINEYYVKNNELPVKNEIVATASLPQDMQSILSKNGDLDDKLYVVDMSKINDATLKKGRGTIESQDVFLVSETKQNVYYLKGYKYKSVVYYTI